MGLLRPATPGFLVTLAAAICLVVVVFCVPYFKSVYFMKAAFSADGQSGYITLGTLGYCFNANGNTTCSKPSVGYEFDPNKLLGNALPVQIPEIAVKWLTYALVLHVVALGLAAVSAVFGLLAHVREMSMACCSTCFSGGAAAITLIAFIFDLVFFFVAKARINKVQGGSATIGTAIWLTLAAWLLLFFAGCFFSMGRCCIGTRGGGGGRKSRRDNEDAPGKTVPGAYGGGGGDGGYQDTSYTETLRLNAVKAEADRKARAASAPREQGLPAFEEFERAPLRHQYVDEDELYADHNPRSPGGYGAGPAAAAGLGAAAAVGAASNIRREPSGYSQHNAGITRQPTSSSAGGGAGGQYPGGYSSSAPGTRAVDNYYNPAATSAAPAAGGYPPTQPYNGALVSPVGAGPSYGIGAVYGAPPARQPSGTYADQYAPQPSHTYPEDPYGVNHAQQPSYDPYARHDDVHDYYGAAPVPAQRSQYDPQPSGYPTGQTYYTANDITPHASSTAAYQQYPPTAERGDSSYFPHPTSATPPLTTSYSPPAGLPPTQAAAHYGPRAMPTTTPTLGASPHSSSPVLQQPHDWNNLPAGAHSSEHHMSNDETLPEYNPYEESGPAIPAALASGGPPTSGKR